MGIQKMKCCELKEKLKLEVNEITAKELLQTLFKDKWGFFNAAVDKRVLKLDEKVDLDSSKTIVTFPQTAGG